MSQRHSDELATILKQYIAVCLTQKRISAAAMLKEALWVVVISAFGDIMKAIFPKCYFFKHIFWFSCWFLFGILEIHFTVYSIRRHFSFFGGGGFFWFLRCLVDQSNFFLSIFALSKDGDERRDWRLGRTLVSCNTLLTGCYLCAPAQFECSSPELKWDFLVLRRKSHKASDVHRR